MKAMRNLGPGVRDSLRESDFDCRREDGRYVSSLAFAMAQLRRMKPAYSFDDIADASELPVWREKVRAKLKELLQIGDGHARPFRLVSEQPRDGYRLRRYEFHPEDGLAVQILALVPESAIESGTRVPAVVCLPGSGASLASLAGEPDACANHFPLRNRQAWFYAKAGMVAVAMENPATAENGVPGVNHYVAQQQFARLMALAGRSAWGFMVEQVLETVDFLRRSPHVDPARIAVSGMSLGCIPALYTAVLSNDIAAVVYNDWVGSWALTAMAQTRDVGGAVDARRPFGFYRWFDDEPDLMAAIAPRPMLFAEGGIWKRGIEKVKRAYALAGAGDRLAVRYYAKYADPASRRHDGEDLKEAQGLTDAQLMEFANVDAPQHSFHPEINVPWLSEVFFGNADLPPELERSIRDSVAAPGAW